MNKRQRIFSVIALVGLYCTLTVSPVYAHAELLKSSPEANAVLAQPPANVVLLFSEEIEPQFSTIKVYDADGIRADAGDAAVDPAIPEQITVSLRPLPDGVYTVAWEVVSTDDGHQTAGSFPFVVGHADISNLPAEQTSSSSLPISALIAKWLLLASGAILAGQFPFIVLVWNPALESHKIKTNLLHRLVDVWENSYGIATTGLLLACVLGILAQAGQAAGVELAAPWAKETIQTLMETRIGMIWLARIILALCGIWRWQRRSPVWNGPVRFVLGLTLLLSLSLTSHAAAEFHPFLPVLADWLHLSGMAFWFGGLVHLMTALAVLQKADKPLRTNLAASMAKHFTWMALPSVAVVGLTGIYSALLRVGSIPALLNTTYGHALLIKQIFVGGLLSLAAVNFLIISPRLQRDRASRQSKSPFPQHFKKTVLAEVIMAFMLLAAVSVMTYLPPARTLPPRTALTGTRTVDDLTMALTISPGLVAQNNTFSVHLSPHTSAQAVQAVILTLVPVSDVPPSEVQLTAQGNDTYTADGTYLSFPGQWLVEVKADRGESFDPAVTFDFNLPKPGSANQDETSTIRRISAGLLVLMGLLFGLDLLTLIRRKT